MYYYVRSTYGVMSKRAMLRSVWLTFLQKEGGTSDMAGSGSDPGQPGYCVCIDQPRSVK